jgi:hypothetical protein
MFESWKHFDSLQAKDVKNAKGGIDCQVCKCYNPAVFANNTEGRKE